MLEAFERTFSKIAGYPVFSLMPSIYSLNICSIALRYAVALASSRTTVFFLLFIGAVPITSSTIYVPFSILTLAIDDFE